MMGSRGQTKSLNETRNVAIYLGRTMGSYKLIDLGQNWGGLRYSSVSGIVYEVVRRLSKDKQMRKNLEEIEKIILDRQMLTRPHTIPRGGRSAL